MTDARQVIAEATARHHLDPDRTDADRHSFCVCGNWAEGEMEPGWDDHMADVAVDALSKARLLLPRDMATHPCRLPHPDYPYITCDRPDMHNHHGGNDPDGVTRELWLDSHKPKEQP